MAESCSSSTNAVILAMDATRERNEDELLLTLKGIRMRGDILCGSQDLLIVFGVLHTVTNPMGYPMKASTDSFWGTHSRLLEEEVLKKIDNYEHMLLQIAQKCEERVSMNVKITAGTPPKIVILQEVISCKASWVILDRHLRRDLKFYLEHIPCKVALIQDSLLVEVRKSSFTNGSSNYASEQKFIYSTERSVLPQLHMQEAAKSEQSVISCGSYAAFSSLDNSDVTSSSKSQESKDQGYEVIESSYKQAGKPKKDSKRLSGPQVVHNLNRTSYKYDSYEKPILCAVCGLKSVLYIKDAMY